MCSRGALWCLDSEITESLGGSAGAPGLNGHYLRPWGLRRTNSYIPRPAAFLSDFSAPNCHEMRNYSCSFLSEFRLGTFAQGTSLVTHEVRGYLFYQVMILQIITQNEESSK